MTRTATRAFTLIELLVVIAIIGILSSVVLASLNSARKKGRDAQRIADVKQIQLAEEMYFDAKGEYTANLSDLVSQNFLPVIPKDPLDNTAYTVKVSGDKTDYVIRASLETDNPVLKTDVDGSVLGVNCNDGPTNGRYGYCVQP